MQKASVTFFFYAACSFKIILAFLFLDHVMTRLFVTLILRSEDKNPTEIKFLTKPISYIKGTSIQWFGR